MKKEHFEELLESIREAGAVMRSQIATTKPEHVTDGGECWCCPEVEVLENGTKMFTHRDVGAELTGREQ